MKSIESSNFEMDLRFYKLGRDITKSNEYILTHINTTAESIENMRNQDDFFYAIGNIKICNSESVKFKKKNIEVLGVYKTDTNQLLLMHSLYLFLSEETVKNYIKYSNTLIITYKNDLFRILFNNRKILNKIQLKDPRHTANIKEKNRFIDQIQFAAMKIYNNSISYFPLIYLKVSHKTEKRFKFFLGTHVNGYLDIDTSFLLNKQSQNINIVEIHANQTNVFQLKNAMKKPESIFTFVLLIHILYYVISFNVFKYTSGLEFIPTIFYDFIFVSPFGYQFFDVDVNDFQEKIVQLLNFGKKVDLLFFSIFLLFVCSYLSIEFIFSTVMFFIIIYYFPFVFDLYSYIIMIFCFSNLLPRIIYFWISENDREIDYNIKSSILMIFLNFLRCFEASYYFLHLYNGIYLTQNDPAIINFTYSWVIIQSSILIYLHYGNKKN